MASTIETAPLTVTVSEMISVNGQDINSSNQVVIPNIKQVDKRIVTIPNGVETIVIAFNAAVLAAGTFISTLVQYLRITNKDDTNFIRIRVKKVVANFIATLGTLTAGTKYQNGVYTSVPLTGGTGTGAIATITASGSGINSLGAITSGSGYVPGTYTAVPLTGGTGTGAAATIVVNSSGNIASVIVTSTGGGYFVADVLSASNSNLGGTGSGFVVPVATLNGGISSVVITSPGYGYTIGDTLTASNGTIGGGTGFSVIVGSLGTSANIFDHKIDPGKSFVMSNTYESASVTNSAFSSFVNADSVIAQADTAPVDIEYFVATL